MKHKFFTNLLLLLFLNLLIKPFWIFGIDRTVQNQVGAADYGLYFSLLNFTVVLNMFLDLGINNFNNRTIAQYKQLLPKYLSYLLSLKLLLAVFYAIICLLIGWLVGYNARQFHLLYFLIVNQFLFTFIYYLRSNISGLHHFKTDSLMSVLDKLLMIGICSVLLFTNWFNGRITIDWFVYAQTIGYGLSALVGLILVSYYAGGFKLNFNLKLYLSFLRKSFPYAILTLLMAGYYRLDSVLIERMLGDVGKEQAGIYAQAFRLLDAAAVFGLLFAGLLLPIFSRMLKEKEDVASLVRLAFELIMVPSGLMVAGAVFYASPIMHFLYHSHADQSAAMLAVLALSLLGISSAYIFGTLLTANGNLKLLNKIAGIFLALNLVLNVLLIPHFQAMGAVWVCALTQLGVAVAQVLLSKSIFGFRINYLLLLRFLGFALFLTVVGKISLYFDNWLWGMSFLCFLGLMYAVAVRLIDLKGLKEIIREK